MHKLSRSEYREAAGKAAENKDEDRRFDVFSDGVYDGLGENETPVVVVPACCARARPVWKSSRGLCLASKSRAVLNASH